MTHTKLKLSIYEKHEGLKILVMQNAKMQNAKMQ